MKEKIKGDKEKFLRALFDVRTHDSFRGITSIGPHRTDLEVIYKEKNMDSDAILLVINQAGDIVKGLDSIAPKQ